VLIDEELAEPHHLLVDSGWITFHIRSKDDIDHAVWLYRLAYLTTTLTMRRQRANHPDAQAVNIQAVRDDLQLQGDLRSVVDEMWVQVDTGRG
jgi:hypothetical protein